MFFTNKAVTGHPKSLMDGENSSLHEICCGPQPIHTNSNPKDHDSQCLRKFPKHLQSFNGDIYAFILSLCFCYYKQSSKENPYIFSLVHMSEQFFPEI